MAVAMVGQRPCAAVIAPSVMLDRLPTKPVDRRVRTRDGDESRVGSLEGPEPHRESEASDGGEAGQPLAALERLGRHLIDDHRQ